MRLLLIGNSHVVPLNQARDAQPDRWAGTRMTFCGFRGEASRDLALEDGALVGRGTAADQMRQATGRDALALGTQG